MDRAIAWVRRRQRALTRAVLALFCLAWLQAAAIPCAMADTSADARSGSVHCPYCPPADSHPSASDHNGACAYPHQAQVDGRSAGALFVALPASTVEFVGALAVRARGVAVIAAPEPVPRVPLPVRYCRYLE